MVKPKVIQKGLKKRGYFLLIAIIFLFALGVGAYCSCQNKQNVNIAPSNKTYLSYITNIVDETESNTYFRKVLFTGKRSQLVVMSIPPGGEVGEETHKYVEQILFFLNGTGEAILDGKESQIIPGDVFVVTPGTKHNFINTGVAPLKIYTVYSPPNHIDGRIHVTKADADSDIQDEAFGQAVR